MAYPLPSSGLPREIEFEAMSARLEVLMMADRVFPPYRARSVSPPLSRPRLSSLPVIPKPSLLAPSPSQSPALPSTLRTRDIRLPKGEAKAGAEIHGKGNGIVCWWDYIQAMSPRGSTPLNVK